MERIETEVSVRDGGHYSPAIKHSGVLYISGQLSVDPATGRPAQGGIKAEAKQALMNLDLVLRTASVPRSNVIQCRVYIPDLAYWGPLNEVYAEFFGDHKPARVVVPSNQLYGGCNVEIEALAACD